MSVRPWVRLDPQDGTNCRSCCMTARTCRDHEPGEVGAVCCDSCDHPNAAGNECVSECLCEEVTGPHLIMTDPTRDAGPCDCPIGVDHTCPAALPTPLNPVLAEKLHKYGLAKCVYAAAHDIEPWTVDETDGGYGDVCELIAEDWNATLGPLVLALGMPDDSDYAAILQRVAKLGSFERVRFM